MYFIEYIEVHSDCKARTSDCRKRFQPLFFWSQTFYLKKRDPSFCIGCKLSQLQGSVQNMGPHLDPSGSPSGSPSGPLLDPLWTPFWTHLFFSAFFLKMFKPPQSMKCRRNVKKNEIFSSRKYGLLI